MANSGHWTQTASGRALDLVFPAVADIDFVNDIATPLAIIPRFNGATRGGPYSVAQHCVLGADALLQETGRPDLAAWFLLHDAHEAYIGDTPTPVSDAHEALNSYAMRQFFNVDDRPRKPGQRSAHKASEARLKQGLDKAIHEAAGIALPAAADAAIIKEMDTRMLKTERDQLCASPPRPWADAIENARPVRMRGRIALWPWPDAADEWLRRLKAWCPQAGL